MLSGGAITTSDLSVETTTYLTTGLEQETELSMPPSSEIQPSQGFSQDLMMLDKGLLEIATSSLLAQLVLKSINVLPTDS